MALLDTEGFGWTTNIQDYVSNGVWTKVNTGHCSIRTGGPLGDNYLRIESGDGNNFNRAIPPASSIVFGCRFYCDTQSQYTSGINFYAPNGNCQFVLTIDASNFILGVKQGDGGVQGSTPARAFSSAAWFFLEIEAVIAPNNGGSATVRVNGSTVLTLTGITTQGSNAGSDLVSSFDAGQANGYGNTAFYVNIAHLYVCDTTGPAPWNTFLGDVRVQTLLPTADDAVQFTPNGQAHNWQNAATVPPNLSTDFNSDATVGDQDTFACAAMAAGLGTVYGVTAKALLAKSDAGNRSMAAVLKSGSTVAVGPIVAVGVSSQQSRIVSQVDPATGAAWTQAGVDAAKVGYRVVA